MRAEVATLASRFLHGLVAPAVESVRHSVASPALREARDGGRGGEEVPRQG